MDRITWLKIELKRLEDVSKCSFNNDGLYNEMRILREKYQRELAALEKEDQSGSKENR